LNQNPCVLDENPCVLDKNPLELFRKHQPDVAVMDLQMPKMEGEGAIAAICANFKHAQIVVLTTFDDDENVYHGLRAGAKSYILKKAEPKELLDAIRTVYKGQRYIAYVLV
jgi:two-component system, NarL family, response regulator